MIAVSAEHIEKAFCAHTVLRDISFSIPQGEIFGLLGPSGSGKTTLIKILTGQLAPTSGSAALFATRSEALTISQRRGVGIMMDEFGVYERLSCFDNLKVFAALHGIDRSAIQKTLEAVGLFDCAKIPAGKLSKGMKSRLRLARAFLTSPQLIFLDEPTSGLDPAAAEEIHAMIAAQKKRGVTVFLTTHDMTEAEKLCDRIALLDEGRILVSGPPAELCRRYNRLRQITLRLSDGTELSFPADPASAPAICALIEQGRMETIHSSEPNLESVFMTLTGNKLNV